MLSVLLEQKGTKSSSAMEMGVRVSCSFIIVIGVLCTTCENRQFTEEEIELAKNSGVDVSTLSEDTVFLTPPKLSDEEQGSKFMPKAYRCDGCKAVIYQLKKSFAQAEKHKKPGDHLSESETLDAFEKVCESEFENYGLKNFQGTKTLAGQGLGTERMSGMVQTGGIWKSRLQNICKDLAGEFEEETVYKWYVNKKFPFEKIVCKNYCNTAKDWKGEFPRDEF